jgi:hypothetical protein
VFSGLSQYCDAAPARIRPRGRRWSLPRVLCVVEVTVRVRRMVLTRTRTLHNSDDSSRISLLRFN